MIEIRALLICNSLELLLSKHNPSKLLLLCGIGSSFATPHSTFHSFIKVYARTRFKATMIILADEMEALKTEVAEIWNKDCKNSTPPTLHSYCGLSEFALAV